MTQGIDDDVAEDMEAEAKKNGWYSNFTENGSGKAEKETSAEIALRLAEEQCPDLFLDQFGTPYGAIKINDHRETLPLKSSRFRNWLYRIYYSSEGKVMNSEIASNILNILKAKAEFDSGERKTLYLRAAIIPDEPNTIYYDLCNKDWDIIKITPDGWTIIRSKDAPILFRRYSSQLPQIYPAKSGEYPTDIFDKFIGLTNIKRDTEGDTRLLLECYIISLLFENVPRPIKMVHGVQGAAKTTFQELIKMLIDPSPMKTLVFPRDGRELIQKLSHNYICYFDNVSYIKDWVSDELCRGTTGLGSSCRELYTDDDDMIRSFMRSIGFNGINLGGTKPDILSRGLIFELEPITKDNRREIKEIWAEFDSIKPQLLAYIFDILVKVLRVKRDGGIKLENLPRMADFAKNAEIISRCMGYENNKFIKAFNKNIEIQTEEAIAANIVANSIVKLMEQLDDRIKQESQNTAAWYSLLWIGTATTLLSELEDIAKGLRINTNGKSWPKAPHSLSRRINEVKTNLKEVGIIVDRYCLNQKTKARGIKICKIASEASEASENENQAQNSSDLSDGIITTTKYRSKIASDKIPENQAQNSNVGRYNASDGIISTSGKGLENIGKHVTYWASGQHWCINCKAHGDKFHMPLP